MAVPLRRLPFLALSWVIWRLWPGRAATKMAEFSHTEAGSGLDMLAATEETVRPELRARYFRHALDELEHARLFRERAVALAPNRGRTQAVLDDTGYLAAHGIRGSESLLAQWGELRFLAFVWVAEKRGAEQFEVYASLLKDDLDTSHMFERIARDERFHIAYSRAELDRQAKAGHVWAVRMAVARVRLARAWEAWGRFAHGFGTAMAGLWLSLLYLLVIGPFSLAASREAAPSGFCPPSADRGATDRAREMA
jgi:hypothetical protein